VDWHFLLKVAMALAPVVVALLLFDRLDMFDLVSLRTMLLYIGIGCALAVAAYSVNGRVLDALPIGGSNFSRYVAPFVEEALKAAPIIVLFAMNRIGFKLDAAVSGFAVGAGFSILENIFYLATYPGANLSVWVVRGLGTAIMHAGSAAVFAVIAHELTERQAEAKAGAYRFNPLPFLPGLGVAILIHGGFNQMVDEPLLAMLGAVLLVPLTLFLVFAKSEKATHLWLTSDLESHQHAIDAMRSGRYVESEAGKRIIRLCEGFRRTNPNDVFEYLGLHTELVLRAEEALLQREAGQQIPGLDEDLAAFDRFHALEAKIGRGVLRALRPHLSFTRNDLWEMGKLEAVAHAHAPTARARPAWRWGRKPPSPLSPP
jgi:RsiW-degrading membrane proteinase PrsW (M82 family)